MSLYYYSLITVFTVIVALMIIEPNFSMFIDLQIKTLRINILRLWLMLRLYPRLLLDQWRIKRDLKKYQKDNGRRD